MKSKLPTTTNSNPMITVTVFLFVALESVLVWQGQRMVDMQDQLVLQGSQNQLKIATLTKDLVSTNDKLATTIQELKVIDTGIDQTLRMITNETKELDRRVTRLEASK